MVKLECKNCGKTFDRIPSAVLPNGNYCSKKCARTGKPNNFVIDGNTVRIKLTQNRYTIIDMIDIDLLANRWCAHKEKNKTEIYYAVRNDPGSRRLIYIHRVVLERILGRPLEPGEEVDHINHDGLDNRHENLRLATKAENLQNARVRNVKKTSKFKGVSWHNHSGKWQAYIQISGKSIYLGLFDIEEDARDAYDVASRKYHGTFGYTNADIAVAGYMSG